MNQPPVPHESIDYGDLSAAAVADAGLDHLWQPLRQAIHEGCIPGAVAAVSSNGQSFHYAGGWAIDTPELRIPATQHTIYDCASLTKVAVTLPLMLSLMQQGRIGLDDPVAHYVPQLHHTSHPLITIRHLLAHTSGLPAEIDCCSHNFTLAEAISHIGKLELNDPPGSARIYSDPGFILLGWLFQQVSGMTLLEGALQWLWQPLQMNESLFCPPPALRSHIAATEYDTVSQSWLHGIVHDENARQLGGVTGHAGLFSTARDLLTYGQSWLAAAIKHQPSTACSPQQINIAQPSYVHLLRSAIESQTPSLPDVHRGLGWVLHGDEADVSGGLLSPAAFGHTGFTGTSLYIDPKQQLVIVLLTNRVHYGRQHSIQHVRRNFHSAVATYAGANNCKR